jgi:hypothetical protein
MLNRPKGRHRIFTADNVDLRPDTSGGGVFTPPNETVPIELAVDEEKTRFAF